jgi:hypothetical protein
MCFCPEYKNAKLDFVSGDDGLGGFGNLVTQNFDPVIPATYAGLC